MKEKINFLYILVGVVCFVSFILVQAVLIYFVVKYRRKKDEPNKKTPYITHNTVIEIIWTVIPSIVLIVLFYYGSVYFYEMRDIPKDALTIEIVGKQWSWDFIYPQVTPAISQNSQNYCAISLEYTGNPLRTPTDCQKAGFKWTHGAYLKVPINTKIVLKMKSMDVIHSFFIPEFEVKQDVLPKQYSYLWFKPQIIGTYDVYCAEYCGTDHSGMITKVQVVSQNDFHDWLYSGGEESSSNKQALSTKELIAKGQELFQSKACATCHSLQGKTGIGPHLNKKFGTKETLEDGSQVLIDENYLSESLLDPQAKIVKGFPPAMPVLNVKETEIKAIIEFLKSLR